MKAPPNRCCGDAYRCPEAVTVKQVVGTNRGILVAEACRGHLSLLLIGLGSLMMVKNGMRVASDPEMATAKCSNASSGCGRAVVMVLDWKAHPEDPFYFFCAEHLPMALHALGQIIAGQKPKAVAEGL